MPSRQPQEVEDGGGRLGEVQRSELDVIVGAPSGMAGANLARQVGRP
jgi:hypothetical protein